MSHLSDFHILTPRTGSVHLMIYRAYDYVKLQDKMGLWIKLRLLINWLWVNQRGDYFSESAKSNHMTLWEHRILFNPQEKRKLVFQNIQNTWLAIVDFKMAKDHVRKNTGGSRKSKYGMEDRRKQCRAPQLIGNGILVVIRISRLCQSRNIAHTCFHPCQTKQRT